jgi:hypothetical protein
MRRVAWAGLIVDLLCLLLDLVLPAPHTAAALAGFSAVCLTVWLLTTGRRRR